MDNYNFLNSIEGKYLSYLVEQVSKVENNVTEIFNTRDFKIKLLLFKSKRKLKKEVYNKLSDIKLKINDFNIENTDNKKYLDDISDELNVLINLIDEKTGNLYKDKVCG